MRTYSFGRCVELLDVDAKVFRRWVKEDLGLSEKDQVSKADSRVRYLTGDQLKQLADLHEKTLPPEDQLAEEKEAISPGAYKLVEDRLSAMEEMQTYLMNKMVTDVDLGKALARLQEAEQRLDQSDQYYKELFASTERISPLESQLTERLTSLEGLVQTLFARSEHLTQLEAQIQAITAPQPPAEDQRIAELETHYQQRIAELEAQLALYKQQRQPTGQPTKKTVGKKKKPVIKSLPSHLAARRAFADLHHVPDSIVATACKNGDIAAVQGKWLYHQRVVYQALGERGKYDFYQRYHERPDFTPCEQCPHDL